MGKRLSKLCLLLVMLCLSLAFSGIKYASAAEGAEEEKDRGLAYIEDVSCIWRVGDSEETVTVKEIEMLPEYKELKEFYEVRSILDEEYGCYYGSSSTGDTDVTCVTVYAKRGAKVSYLKGSKMKVADEPDCYTDNEVDDYAVYRFHVPYKTVINGGTFTATAELKGEKKELKVVFAKPVKKSVKYNKKVKATIVASKDWEYGEISLSMDDKEVYRVPIEYEDVRDGASVWVYPSVDQIGTESSIYYDGESESRREDPIYFWADEDGCSEDLRWKDLYVALDGEPTDTEWKIKSIIWDVNIKLLRRVKVKIPAQKAAPKVKVDMIKEKIGISSNMQYRIELPVINEDGELTFKETDWKDGKKGMTFADLGDIVSGADIYVRIKGKNGKIPSAKRYIAISSRQDIDLTKISAEGPVSQCAIKISDLDKAKNPYEYTCAEPTKTTKWKTLKSTSVNLKKNELNETTPVIYVRQKALNENAKKNIEMRQASTIAVLTYDSATQKWTAKAWDMSKLK